jgi:hypothetical protein
MRVVEKQTRNVVREYNIVGPSRETVESFWRYLLMQNGTNVIGFVIAEEDG